MMMVPEAWQKNELMPENKRAFYESLPLVPDGAVGRARRRLPSRRQASAPVLDRNGLRPSRYYLTHDDRVIMASEVGVVPIDPANVKAKGRLEPGRMFFVDFERGRLVPDDELKNEFANRQPVRRVARSESHSAAPSRWQQPQEPKVDNATLLPRHAVVRLHDRDDAVHAAADGARASRPSARWATASALAVLSTNPRTFCTTFGDSSRWRRPADRWCPRECRSRYSVGTSSPCSKAARQPRRAPLPPADHLSNEKLGSAQEPELPRLAHARSSTCAAEAPAGQPALPSTAFARADRDRQQRSSPCSIAA